VKLICCLTAIALIAPVAALGQGYPDKPIRVIVPVPAGGTPDVVARMVAPGLSNLLGQQLVMDNRGGAGGLIGAELAAKAIPDGYTLFFSSPGALTILPHLQKHVAYDTLRDFRPSAWLRCCPTCWLSTRRCRRKHFRSSCALRARVPVPSTMVPAVTAQARIFQWSCSKRLPASISFMYRIKAAACPLQRCSPEKWLSHSTQYRPRFHT